MYVLIDVADYDNLVLIRPYIEIACPVIFEYESILNLTALKDQWLFSSSWFLDLLVRRFV